MTPSLPRPIFVVGMNGSGTTMLLHSLGNHSEIYAHPPETQIIPHYIQSIHKYGDLDRDSQFLRLWMDILSERSLVISNSGRTLPLPSDWKEYGRTVGEVFNYAFSYFATSLHKSIWAEKTPMHVFYISDLADRFPSARFIHVIRDGRDCAASFHRRWKRTPWLTTYRWKKAVLAGHSQGVLLGKDRYMEVKYEDQRCPVSQAKVAINCPA